MASVELREKLGRAGGGRLLRLAALLAAVLVTNQSSWAQTFTTLFRFDVADGAEPMPGLLQAADGMFYGATATGGADGDGSIFRMTAAGTLTTLHNFSYGSGAGPYAVLIQAANGAFYGITIDGGKSHQGSIFRMSADGAIEILYSFCSLSDCADGKIPKAALVQAADGSFYGTTSSGGAYGGGTVFNLTANGQLTTLYSFCLQSNCADGSQPEGPLIQATDGSFYGTTSFGGTSGYGTVFRMTSGGMLTSLHDFCSQSRCSDGGYPVSGVIQATDGNFYGTTARGGANTNGSVFKITSSGDLTTLHSFDYTDGDGVYGGLIEGTDGNFYGVTAFGAFNSNGTIFRITPGGALTTLYEFCTGDCSDGYYPVGRLVQATNGIFYGITENGGPNAAGTIFSLDVGTPAARSVRQ